MANSLNKTIIIGRLGMDPELRRGKKTDSVRFTLAEDRYVNGCQQVQWHKIVAFGKRAAACRKFLHKGDLCCVEGRLDAHPYEKDGEKRTYHSIVAEDVQFLGSKRKTDAPKNSVSAMNRLDEALF